MGKKPVDNKKSAGQRPGGFTMIEVLIASAIMVIVVVLSGTDIVSRVRVVSGGSVVVGQLLG